MVKYGVDFEQPIIELEQRLADLKKNPSAAKKEYARQIERLEKQVYNLKIKIYSNLTSWQRVQLARHPKRPRFLTYLSALFSDFLELHGDRLYSDDRAVIGGLAYLDNFRVVVIGNEKGGETKEKVEHNFGMPNPDGFRKAARLFRLAAKFKLPIINFIDTPGAYPGIEAEEHGQALAIAENLKLLSELSTPVVAVNIGEGGSGGALALGLADRVFMLENAYYSVITPEGCANILWQDPARAAAAAAALSLTADKLYKLKLIDGIIAEPLGGLRGDIEPVRAELRRTLIKAIKDLGVLPAKELVVERYRKYRRVGVFSEDKFYELAQGMGLIKGKKR